MRLLTAQRGGEIVGMRWADLDEKIEWWTIPASATKNGKAHRVPITDRARAIIQAQPRSDDQPLVFAGSGRSVADAAKKAPGRIGRELRLANFRGHDLRRTAATRMGAAGIPRDDISAVLNHTAAGEDTRYRHLINAVKTGGRIGRIVYTTTDDPDYEGIKDSI